MFKFLMILGCLQGTYQTYLMYDTGLSKKFDTDACNSTVSPVSETRLFSGTFQNVPQIFVYTNYFSINNPGASQVHVQVNLHDIVVTVNGFTITLSCFGNNIKRYHYIWYAFADTRMTVIYPGLQPIIPGWNNFSHPHTNTKATQAFAIMTSMDYTGIVNFNITVQSVTSTGVNIQIYSINDNITALGYFVVVGTDESFSLTGPIYTGPGDTPTIVTSNILKIPPNGVLICTCFGFSWSDGQQPRVESDIYYSGSTVYYTLGTFPSTHMDDIYFNQIWVYTEPYYPMLIDKYSVTRIYYRHPGFKQKVIILGQNITFTQIGIYNLQIPDATTSVTIEIYLEHQPQKKISGTLLKCNNCGTQNKYYLKYYYISVYNFTKFVVQLVQQANYNYKYLTISILSTGISIKQETNLSDDHSTLVNLYFE